MKVDKDILQMLTKADSIIILVSDAFGDHFARWYLIDWVYSPVLTALYVFVFCLFFGFLR